MSGVEILAQEIIYNTFLPEWTLGIWMALAIMFVGIMAFCFSEDHPIVAFVSLGLAIGMAIPCGLTDVDNKNNINYVEYKVTIDDSVSMNEFLNKYEILDQEGKIYTVREKE